MAKYVVIVGCLHKGERCKPGDIIRPDKGDAAQLVAIGRIVDVDTEAGAKAATEAKEKAIKAAKAAKPTKGKMPGAND